jgi:hypothetical protein
LAVDFFLAYLGFPQTCTDNVKENVRGLSNPVCMCVCDVYLVIVL